MSLKPLFFDPRSGLLRPGWRIPWLLVWVLPLLLALRGASWVAHHRLPAWSLPLSRVAIAAGLILGALAIFRAFVRRVERRPPVEVQLDRRTPRALGIGFLLGGGVMLLITGILVLAGSYRIAGFQHPEVLLHALVFYLPQTFVEDFLFCLALFRPLRDGLGRRPALVVAPLVFMLAHVSNTNESVLGLAEVLTGGVVMYYVFDRTGRFWAVWGLHFSWNFTMNGVLGMANSGQALPGWITPRISGPAWLTGGATGPEASVLAVGLDLLALVLLARISDARLRGDDASAGLPAR